MLMDYTGENAQSQAAKLMEVVALQYRGEIDNVKYFTSSMSLWPWFTKLNFIKYKLPNLLKNVIKI